MANLVVHFEIHASEPQKAIDFYSSLLGWTFQNYGGGEQPYWVIDTGEGAIGNAAGKAGLGINGGLTQRMGPRPEIGAPVNGCNIVVGVDDVDGLMRRGIELGATEALPATDWPGNRPRGLPPRSRRQRLGPHLAGSLRRDGRDGRRRRGLASDELATRPDPAREDRQGATASPRPATR